MRGRNDGENFEEVALPSNLGRRGTTYIYDDGLIFTEVDFEAKRLESFWYMASEDTWPTPSTYAQDSPLLGRDLFVDGESLVSNIWSCAITMPMGGDVLPCKIERLSIDGTISTVAEISEVRGNGFQSPHINIIDGELFLSALTVWRFIE